MPDVRLTCVMLRALWGLGIMDCVGIMVSLDPHAQPDHGHPATNPATPRPPVSGKASGPSAAAPASEGGGANEEGARWRRKAKALQTPVAHNKRNTIPTYNAEKNYTNS